MNNQIDNSKINKLTNKINSIENKVNGIINNINLIKNVDSIQTYVHNLDESINNSQDKIDKIVLLFQQATDLKNAVEEIKNKFDIDFKNINTNAKQSAQLYNNINSDINNINKRIAEITELNADSLKLHEEIKSIYNAIIELQNKHKKIYNDNLNYRKQILDLNTEIFGDEYSDEKTGKPVKKDGLKQKIENLYKQLEQKNESLSKTIDDTVEKAAKDTNDKLANFMDTQKNKYENLFSKIENLLPSALTAGLASAYGEKRKNEEESLKNSNKKFIYSIIIAILVACIPFYLAYEILQTNSLDETISYIPKLMTFLIPVYLPVIWLAVHFNKQIKLSKRLIEEYTHKEVLNKTFEGLAKQIDQLDISSENYNELRSKLLYNIIEMSSHNPGQLIKGFEHTDHPLIEVLNKITQSEETLDKLQNIPGISVIINKLQSRINKKKENTNKEILDLTQEGTYDK